MKLNAIASTCLLFTGIVSAGQDSLSQSSYDPARNLLTIPIVKAGRDYLSAELIDLGGYQFKLQKSASYANIVPDVYPSYDPATSLLTIPHLSVAGKIYAVTLRHTGNLIFELTTVKEVDTTPKLDPLEAITPKARYVMGDDGTFTDQQTGLQWMRCSYGQTWTNKTCSGFPSKVEMEEATYSANRLTFAGKSDWRLPSIDELKSIIYCSSGKPKYWNATGSGCQGDYQQPTLYQDAFPNNGSGVYWSITNLQNDPGPDYNLTASFNYGHVYYSYFEDAFELARFVRGDSNIAPAAEAIGGFRE